MRYWLFDSIKSGEEFDRELDARTMAEAVEIATAEWNGLSKHDRERREDFFVGAIPEACVYECDLMGWGYYDAVSEIVDIKAGEGVNE